MKLKNKLFLLLVSVSLSSFLLMGFLSRHMVHTKIFRETVHFLSLLTDLHEKRVNQAISHYLEDFKLLTSRLRLNVAHYGSLGQISEEEALSLSESLKTIKGSMYNVERFSILDLNGNVLSSCNVDLIGQEKKILFSNDDRLHAQVTEIFKNDANQLRARLLGPLFSGDELIGFVEMEREIDELISITEDHTGLGMTGEVLLAKRNALGDAIILTPLLFDSSAALNRVVSNEIIHDPVISAVNGIERIFDTDEYSDYRAEPVIAVSRFIEGLDWGLVVKMDRKEALGMIDRMFKDVLLPSAIILFFVLIPLSFLLSRIYTKQFIQFMNAIKKIKAGDFSFFIDIKNRDEIGQLADSFNSMGKELKTFYHSLEETVQNRARDLKTAHAKNKAILSSIKESLVFIDVNETVLMMNKMAEELTGYYEKDSVGKKCDDVIHLKIKKGHVFSPKKCGTKKLIQSHNIHSIQIKMEDDYYMTSKDKRLFPVSILASKVFSEGEIIGVIILFRDVSKEKELNQIKNEFISMASSQLRTPLASVQWYLDMMQEEGGQQLSNVQLKALKEISKNTNKMNQLVNGFLNVPHLESGRLRVDPIETDLNDFILAVIQGMESSKGFKNVVITTRFDSVVNLISIDPHLLQHVLSNLLLNAMQYGAGSNGRCKIQIHVRKKKSHCYIDVRDNGEGVPRDIQPLLFNKFVRSIDAKEKNPEGVGLSLYISRLIIEACGGKLLFVPSGKKGAMFSIVLPESGMKENQGGRSLFR